MIPLHQKTFKGKLTFIAVNTLHYLAEPQTQSLRWHVDQINSCVFCLHVELWKQKSWERSISVALFLNLANHYNTPTLASHGLEDGSTTSCTVKAPFQNTAEQYVSLHVFTFSFLFSALRLSHWSYDSVSTLKIPVSWKKMMHHLNYIAILSQSRKSKRWPL